MTAKAPEPGTTGRPEAPASTRSSPAAITPARIRFADGEPPHAPDFGDRYHAQVGWLEQARHVFLAGSGLPQRWASRERFAILETGFGLGGNFAATLDAWRADPQRPRRLHYVALDLHPPGHDDLKRAWAERRVPASIAADLQHLLARWPPLLPMLHRLQFCNGAVELLLGFGDAATMARALTLQADALFLDGFAPDRNPGIWSPALWQALARCAAPGCTAATWSVARVVREGLAAAGFETRRAAGIGGKREVTTARFVPRFHPQRAPARRAERPEARDALVIGSGIAGLCAGAALIDGGMSVRMIDDQPDRAASRLPGGIVRPMRAQDQTLHGRFSRAAAFAAVDFYREALRQLADGDRNACFDGLVYRPGEDAAETLTAAGWLKPLRLLQELPAAIGVRQLSTRRVVALRRQGDAWLAIDEQGHLVAQAPIVVLANAGAAAALVPWAQWPMQRRRGQLSLLEPRGRAAPAMPLAGGGHAFALPDGAVIAGSTSSLGDEEPGLRAADHQANRATLARLSGDARWLRSPQGDQASDIAGGFVGWRAGLPDRLPLVGPVPLDPALWPAGARAHPVRLVPRAPGLFAVAALGSRGLTWAPLAGRIVAALATGAPVPLEADLLDAIDPARFISRERARGGI